MTAYRGFPSYEAFIQHHKERPRFSRFPCPYRMCSAILNLVWEPPPPWLSEDTPSHWLAPLHDISNALLKGSCPASLLRLPYDRRDPFSAETTRALTEAYERDAKEVPRLIGEEHHERERAWFWRTRKPTDSFSARGPHRMGREPAPDAIDDWQIGGREDEDIKKQDYAINRPQIPKWVMGQEVGQHVATISEIIGMIHHAAMKTGEAIAAIQQHQNDLDQIRASLEEAIDTIAGAQGQHSSQLLEDYLAILHQEQNNVEQLNVLMEGMKGSIMVGQEKGEDMIGRLLS